MQRWEYLFVSSTFLNNVWRPEFVNGQPIGNWRATTIYDYSNALGQEGWELVNLATTDRSQGDGSMPYIDRGVQTFRLVFKRRRESSES